MSAQYTDARAEWDDRAGVFRVYLLMDDLDAEPKPMRSVLFENGGAVECRLYRAAFVRCTKDIAHLSGFGALGFEKEAAAKRVASAVKKELSAIAAGKPGPSDDAIRIALALLPRKGARK